MNRGRCSLPGGRTRIDQRRDGTTTLNAFADEVFDRREAEGKSSVGRERRMWKARVSDRIGSLPVTTIPKEKIEDFRDYLDGEVRARIASGKAEGISGKTAMIV